jgi:putative aldouronate transport system substrate-binding protein
MKNLHWGNPLAWALAFALILGLIGCAPQASQDAAVAAPKSAVAPGGKPNKDPFGPLPEKTVLTVFKTETDYDLHLNKGETQLDNLYVKTFGQKLNIDYQFPIVMKGGPAANDKLNLMIASNDLLDVNFVGIDTFNQMVKADMLQDLTESYNDFASVPVRENYTTDNGKALEMVTRNGKLYGIPAMGTVHNSDPLLWIRQDWLDKLGLKGPSNMAELEAVLKAFVEKDPDGNGKKDTVGLIGQQDFINESPQGYAYDAIFTAYKSYVRNWITKADGTVEYGSIQPETKAALAKLRELYAAGLLPKDFPITKPEQAQEPIVAGRAGAFFGPWWAGWSPLTDVIKANPKAVWRAYVIKNVDGKSYSKQEAPVAGIAVLKKGYKYPEALIKSINYYFQVQVDDPALIGGDPYNGKDPNADWAAVPVALGLWRADAVIRDHMGMAANAEGKPMPFAVTKYNEKYYKDVAAAWVKGEDWLKANPDSFGDAFSRFIGVQPIIDAATIPVFSAYYGTTPTLEKRKVNLDKLEVQSFLNIIVGDKPVDSFDEFVKQWKEMGGTAVTQEVNSMLK